MLRGIRFGLAAGFLLQLPAEADQPLISIGPIGVTNLELTGYLLLASWLVSLLLGVVPMPRIARLPILLLAAVFVAALAASAFAVADAGGSLKVLLRLGAALLIGLALAVEVVTNPRRGVLGAVALGAAVLSAILGIAEYLTGWTVLGGFLGLFRDAPVSAGGFVVRATGTLLHPNLAAWYWGAAGVTAAAFAVGLRGRPAWILWAATLPLFAAAVLALSRGALLGTGAAALAALVLLARRGAPLLRAGLVIVPLLVVTIGAVALSPAARARLMTESDQLWYRFSIEAPQTAELGDRINDIRVTVHNESPVTWQREGFGAVAVAYHIRDANGDYIAYGRGRTALPDDLAPQASVEVVVPVRAPPVAETVTVEWDLGQGDGDTWFSTRLPQPVPTTEAMVTYGSPQPGSQPPAVDAPTADEQDLYASRGLTRGTLWAIAIEMLAERPLTGIGLDNYRLIYGSRAGLSLWDQDFNATNVYLEMLVGIGIAGVLLFVVGAIAGIRILRRALRACTRVNVVAGIFLVAFAVHGVFDSFITFSTAMYLTAAVVALGLWESGQAEQA